MSIKVVSKTPVSDRLKANLVALAGKYYSSGSIEVGDPTVTHARQSIYHPDNAEYSNLVIRSIGDDLHAIGSIFGKITDPKVAAFKQAFDEAQKRAASKQPAPVSAKYTDEARINAIKQLSQYRGQPIIIMYRESYSHCYIYAGGKVVLRKGKAPAWDKKGVNIERLIALALNADYDETKGMSLDGYPSAGVISAKGEALIAKLNIIARNTLGYYLIDPACVGQVTARGIML